MACVASYIIIMCSDLSSGGASSIVIIIIVGLVALPVMGHITGMVIVILYLIRKREDVDIYAGNKDLLEGPTVSVENDKKQRKKLKKKRRSSGESFTTAKTSRKSMAADYTQNWNYFSRNRSSVSSFTTAWEIQ